VDKCTPNTDLQIHRGENKGITSNIKFAYLTKRTISWCTNFTDIEMHGTTIKKSLMPNKQNFAASTKIPG